VPLLYAPVAVLAATGAMVAARVYLGMTAEQYWRAAAEHLELGDLGFGLAWAAALGVIPAIWTRAGRSFAGSAHRRLAFKLAATFLGAQFLLLVTGAAADAQRGAAPNRYGLPSDVDTDVDTSPSRPLD